MAERQKTARKKKRDLRGGQPPVSLRDTNRKAIAQDLPQEDEDSRRRHIAKPGGRQRAEGEYTRT